jgi:hypothetical protein
MAAQTVVGETERSDDTDRSAGWVEASLILSSAGGGPCPTRAFETPVSVITIMALFTRKLGIQFVKTLNHLQYLAARATAPYTT